MTPPTAQTMLDAWEDGQNLSAVARGLVLLSLALPEEPSAALAEFTIGERDRRLFALRKTVFGPHLTGLAVCPACGDLLELDVPSAALHAQPKTVSMSLERDGFAVQLRLPDSRDLSQAASQPAEAALVLLARCIVDARHEGDPVEVEDLPPAIVDSVAARLAEADPQADMRLAIRCGCGHGWSEAFDMATFLWTEVEAWAIRLLQDVHILARYYGWPEGDILRLKPARRSAYLRMIAA